MEALSTRTPEEEEDIGPTPRGGPPVISLLDPGTPKTGTRSEVLQRKCYWNRGLLRLSSSLSTKENRLSGNGCFRC